VCQVCLGNRFKRGASEAFAGGIIAWTHTPGTLDVITCICRDAPFCTNSFILISPVTQMEQQPLTHPQNKSLVTRHSAIGPALNKHFVILHAPLHIQLQLPTPPRWCLLRARLGQRHFNSWRFPNTSPLSPSCCFTPGSPPILTKPSAVYSIAFTLSLWSKSCKTGQILSAA